MNWEKNAFGYFMWFLYTIAVGSGLFCMLAFWGDERGYSLPVCLLLCCLCLFAAGASVFLMRLFAGAVRVIQEKKRLPYYLEGAAVLALLGAGLFLCIRNLPESIIDEGYYELARVTQEHEIIQVVHGAVYVYLRLLHMVCLLFGNKVMVCVWLQTVLYMPAAVIFYMAVRRLAGAFPAVLTLAFMMFSPFLTAQTRFLSPDILFLLIYAAALYLSAGGLKESRRGFVRSVFTGIVIGLVIYLDIMGVTLLLLAPWILTCSREERNGAYKHSVRAIALCLAGAAAGFFCCILTDAFLSGKEFFSVLSAWGSLYVPKGFKLPVVSYGEGAYWDIGVLLFLMCIGIFSFWCVRKKEKISAWVFSSGVLIAAQCFCMTTNEMPGFRILFLFLAILAGIGVSSVFVRDDVMLPADEEAEETEKTQEAEKAGEDEEAEKTQGAEMTGGKERNTRQARTGTPVKYIDNPLPLPKKHVARKMDFKLEVVELEELDYDYQTQDGDDFDI